jgi:hypothetical protein
VIDGAITVGPFNPFDRPHEVDRNEESGWDGEAALPRPPSRDCPAFRLEVTYAVIVFGFRPPLNLRIEQSAGPLWLEALYSVAAVVRKWSGPNGVKRIWKGLAAVVGPVQVRPGGFAKRNRPGAPLMGGRRKLSPRRIDL